MACRLNPYLNPLAQRQHLAGRLGPGRTARPLGEAQRRRPDRGPLVEAPWGDSFGMLNDRFGTSWMVNITGPGNR